MTEPGPSREDGVVPSEAGSVGGLRPSLLVALMATAAALVFAPALGGGFIYDDHHLIEKNGLIRSFGYWRYWLTHDFWDVGADTVQFSETFRYWRPAVTASYSIDWQLGDGSPIVFHATNLVWHAGAAVLAFRALRRWSGVAWAAALATLVFALHPTKAESVAWISGRTDVLCLVVVLLVCELDVLRRSMPERRSLFIGLEVLATVLAYMLKEHAIVIPALLAVEEWAVRGRGAIDRPLVKAAVRRALPQLGVALSYLAVRSVVLPARAALELPALARAELFSESMGRYAALVFAPHDLSVQQAMLASHRGNVVFDWRYVALGASFVLGLAVAAWSARRRVPGVTIGIAVFATLLLPTSNLVPMGMFTMVSERFLYMPMLGLALVLACLLARLPEARRKLGAGVVLVAVALLSVQAARRAHDFSDEDAFWRREIALHAGSIEPMLYFIARDIEKRELLAALQWTGRAMEVSRERYQHWGLEVEFAVRAVQILLMLTPDNDVDALRGLDAFVDRLAKAREGAVRLDSPELVITLSLSHPRYQRKLDRYRPRLLAFRAEIASRLGEDERSVALAREAVLACPGCAEIGSFAAVACARASRYDEASSMLDAVARRSSEVEVENTRRMLAKARALAGQAASAPAGALRLQLRAEELSTLEAWGRAYGVLSPYKKEIKGAPGVALGFAELAYRAGDLAVAKEMLTVVAPPERHEAILRDWSEKMGWQRTER